MSDAQTSFTIGLAVWACWSIAGASSRLGRIADAMEQLRDMAERGRR